MTREDRLPEGLGGLSVRRSERGVHREAGPWTPTVHAFLNHLREAGFAGAPSVVGTDETGSEIVTYIDGEVLGAGPTWRPGEPTPWPQWARTEECLVATGHLLRSFHDSAATFVPPQPAVWRRYHVPALGSGEIVCHSDIGPHNTVYRDGKPVAFIDWDTIRPNDRLVEFGHAAWKYVPLGDNAYFERSDFPARPNLAQRLALFASAYGITDGEIVAWAMHQAKQRAVGALRHFPISAREGATALRQVADDPEWLDSATTNLLAELD